MTYKNCLTALFLTLLIGCSRSPNPGSGWITYSDTKFTRDAPYQVEKDSTYFFEWAKVDSVTIGRPPDVSTWIRGGRFVPEKSGEAFVIRIDYEVKSTVPTNNVGELIVDIGSSTSIAIQERTFSIPKDTWTPDSKTILIYAGDTFEANGAKIGLKATNQSFFVGRYGLTIARIHNPIE